MANRRRPLQTRSSHQRRHAKTPTPAAAPNPLQVLKVGGTYVLITSWAPPDCLPYLTLLEPFWDVDHRAAGWFAVYKVTKRRHPPHTLCLQSMEPNPHSVHALCAGMEVLLLNLGQDGPSGGWAGAAGVDYEGKEEDASAEGGCPQMQPDPWPD